MTSWLSSWFGSGADAAPPAPTGGPQRRSFSQSAEDTWRPLYAPGRNPNMKAGSPAPCLPAVALGRTPLHGRKTRLPRLARPHKAGILPPAQLCLPAPRCRRCRVQGSSYYDTVKDPKSEPSVWEYVLKSQALSKKSFDSMCVAAVISPPRLPSGWAGRQAVHSRPAPVLTGRALAGPCRDENKDGYITQPELQAALNNPKIDAAKLMQEVRARRGAVPQPCMKAWGIRAPNARQQPPHVTTCTRALSEGRHQP